MKKNKIFLAYMDEGGERNGHRHRNAVEGSNRRADHRAVLEKRRKSDQGNRC